ncbi:MAG: cupin domain-containing protein [Solirubrobacteraceae bacterium]
MSATQEQIRFGGTTAREPATIGDLDVLEGSPISRYSDLIGSPQDRVLVNVWDCTAGRMQFDYWADETVHILEGEATVVDEHGRVFELRAGDVAHFVKGSRLTWTVPSYVRKLAIYSIEPAWRRRLERPARVLRRIARLG